MRPGFLYADIIGPFLRRVGALSSPARPRTK